MPGAQEGAPGRDRDRHRGRQQRWEQVVRTVAVRAVSMPITVVAGEQALERIDQVRLRAAAGFDQRQAAGGVWDVDVEQAGFRTVCGEVRDGVGQVEDLPVARCRRLTRGYASEIFCPSNMCQFQVGKRQPLVSGLSLLTRIFTRWRSRPRGSCPQTAQVVHTARGKHLVTHRIMSRDCLDMARGRSIIHGYLVPKRGAEPGQFLLRGGHDSFYGSTSVCPPRLRQGGQEADQQVLQPVVLHQRPGPDPAPQGVIAATGSADGEAA